jgi:hypothetical protein
MHACAHHQLPAVFDMQAHAWMHALQSFTPPSSPPAQCFRRRHLPHWRHNVCFFRPHIQRQICFRSPIKKSLVKGTSSAARGPNRNAIRCSPTRRVSWGALECCRLVNQTSKTRTPRRQCWMRWECMNGNIHAERLVARSGETQSVKRSFGPSSPVLMLEQELTCVLRGSLLGLC